MKTLRILAVMAVLAIATNVQAVKILDYSSVNGASIASDGLGNFSFTPLQGSDIQVTLGTAAGSMGSITGTFGIGAITTSGGVSTAPVTGTGLFTIAADSAFSATLTWNDITQIGQSGSLNVAGVANLSNIQYTGSLPGLLLLKNANEGANVLTFQLVGLDLAGFKTTAYQASYSGTLSTVPDGGLTAMLLGGALSTLAFIRRRMA